LTNKISNHQSLVSHKTQLATHTLWLCERRRHFVRIMTHCTRSICCQHSVVSIASCLVEQQQRQRQLQLGMSSGVVSRPWIQPHSHNTIALSHADVIPMWNGLPDSLVESNIITVIALKIT